MKNHKVVLLDRDGTIIVDKNYLHEADGVELLLGSVDGLKLLYNEGYRLIIISNQSGVGRGYFSVEEVNKVNDRLTSLLKAEGVEIAGYYCCFHAPEEGCDCRKPKIGLVEQAMEELDFNKDDISAVIGDKASDIELGKNLEAFSILIGTDTKDDVAANVVVSNLLDAASIIIEREPDIQMNKDVMLKQITENFEDHRRTVALMDTLKENILKAALLMIESLANGGRIFFCGNGGSAADAQHLAAELSGRYLKNRSALDGIALTCNSSAVTAIGNDFGYDEIFARQLEAHGRTGDTLVAITTGGSSPNILKVVEEAKKKGIKIISMTGSKPTSLSEQSDVHLAIPVPFTPRIQEMHILVGHTLCELIESQLCK